MIGFEAARSLTRFLLSRVKASEYTLMILLALLIGLGGGSAAVAFRYLIRIVQFGAFGSWDYGLEVVRAMPWYFLIFIPAIGGVAISPLITKLAREAKGHGVPEVMEAVALRGGVIRGRLVLVKALASSISIGTGGSVGREGPIVQIGSAFGSTIGQILKVSAPRLRTLVGCGAAAGIAGTFNAPIAGALFSVEIILGDFGVGQFTPIVISSVVSTIVSQNFLGNWPAFIVPGYELVSAYELLPYFILGFMAAAVGVGFTTILYKTEDLFDRLEVPTTTKPIIGGIILGSLAVGFPQILGVGYETIDIALAGQMAWGLALGLIFLKLIGTSITLASGGSGGIFAPSLFLGAMTGGFLGKIVHSLFPSITGGAGAYATVGMGAVVAATTHGPLTAMIIIFEMTGNYKIIPPLMVACVLSTVLAMRFKKNSIYTEKLARRGVELFEPFEVNILKRLPVTTVITKEPIVISEKTPFRRLIDLVVNSNQSEFFVTRAGNHYVGTISVHHLRQVLLDRDWLDKLIIAQDMADASYPILGPEDNLDLAMKLLAQENTEEIAVVAEGVLLGSVRKRDVIDVYNREVFRRDLAGGVQGAMTWAQRAKSIDLGEGYVLAEVEAPPYFAQKTLRELNVRATLGIEVILIKKTKKASGGTTMVPYPDYSIELGDVLFVAGKPEQVKKLTE